MKIYVASSWRNTLYPEIVAALKTLGHDVYDFRNPPGAVGFGWSQIEPVEGHVDVTTYRRLLGSARAKEGYTTDMAALKSADACVYVLPCGRSASWEFGYAMGSGKPCYVVWFEPHEPELMFMEATILGSMGELERAFRYNKPCKRCGKPINYGGGVFCGAECTALLEIVLPTCTADWGSRASPIEALSKAKLDTHEHKPLPQGKLWRCKKGHLCLRPGGGINNEALCTEVVEIETTLGKWSGWCMERCEVEPFDLACATDWGDQSIEGITRHQRERHGSVLTEEQVKAVLAKKPEDSFVMKAGQSEPYKIDKE